MRSVALLTLPLCCFEDRIRAYSESNTHSIFDESGQAFEIYPLETGIYPLEVCLADDQY